MKYLIFILFWSSNVCAISIKCTFEEVYSSGEVQQGFFLLNDKNLRYEYYDPALFTLLYLNNNLFYSENINRKKVQQIENQNSIIPHLISVYDDHPNYRDIYEFHQYEIKVQLSSNKLLKNLIVKSDKLNVRIHFNNCNEDNIEKKYLNFNPILDYVFD